MIRSLITLTIVLLFYFVYGFYLSQVDLKIIPQVIKRDTSSDIFYDYRGVINVRTSNSNGSSDPQRVAKAAKSVGLDFLYITELNDIMRTEPLNSYVDGVLVSTDNEFTFLDSRLLYLQNDSGPTWSSLSHVNLFLTDALSKRPSEMSDSILILSQPFKNGPTWVGDYPSGLDGIEVLNPKIIADKAWRKSKLSVIWSFIIYPFNPRYAFLRLFSEPTEEFNLADQMSQSRRTVLFSGADASARAVPLANTLLRFPSYEMNFAIAQNHILLKSELTGQYQKDKQKIFSALKNGHFYISLDLLGDPKGFSSIIEDNEKTYLMGESIKFKKNMVFRIKLPEKPVHFFEIVLFRNGERMAISNDDSLNVLITEPGVYRVAVRVSPMLPLPEGKRWITWIYTNNYYVGTNNN